MNYPCPCCSYLTLEHPANGSYDICPVCFWEDDPVQNDEPTFTGGANRPSLEEAKRNFATLGATESRLQEFTRPPREEEHPKP